MNSKIICITFLFLSACSHTVNFRASHFAIPVVNEQQWSGHFALVGAGATRITVVDDISSNPPLRTKVGVNNNSSLGDLLFANNFGADVTLTVGAATEVYLDNSLWGLRYQFLNHGPGADVWVGSIQGAYGAREDTTTTGNNGTISQGVSKIISSQAGISLGYKYAANAVPYFSYIHEAHEISTKVTNPGGAFGPFLDKGIHHYYTFGLSSYNRGFTCALEYNMIDLAWEHTDNAYQNSLGAKFGYAW